MNSNKNKIKQFAKKRRQNRVRARISGTRELPRLRVSKSLHYVFLQLIDDSAQKTLVSFHSKKLKEKGAKTELAHKAGEELAKVAVEKGIKKCVFDRGGSIYHGIVKAAAEGARKGGLQF